MTIELGWKHVVVAAALVAVAVLGTIRYIRQIQQRDVLDAERQTRVLELEAENKELKQLAADALEEADQRHEDLEAARDELETSRVAAAQARRGPIPAPQEVELLRNHTDLLEAALSLAAQENLALRRSLALTGAVLDRTEEQLDLTTKRLQAANRRQKKERRRSILTNMGTTMAAMGIGYGLGRL